MTNSARTLEDYFTTKRNKRMSLCSNFNTSLKTSWSISLQYVRRIHRVCTQCITEKILKSQYFQGYLNTCWHFQHEILSCWLSREKVVVNYLLYATMDKENGFRPSIYFFRFFSSSSLA